MSRRKQRARSDEPARAAPIAAKVANLATARFECVYPSCGGLCCMNGRPAVERDEEERIRANVDKFVDQIRPEARAQIAQRGFLDARVTTDGRPTIAVSQGWCVFFQDGCVLQKVGAQEGLPLKYKPWRCTLFPLKRDPRTGEWFVRQRGERGERWDLFCLNPEESSKRADATLRGEVEQLRRFEEEGRGPPQLRPLS